MGSCTITNKGTLKAGDGLSIDNNTISNTAGLYYTESVGTVSPTPINADQLEGHGSSYFQQTLVSGTNIKTINNSSLLGSGNITISRGVSFLDIYPVGAIYQNTNNVNPGTFMTGTTWTLRSSVALASEHVFGNGYAQGVTDGTTNYSFSRVNMNSNWAVYQNLNGYGKATGTNTGALNNAGGGDLTVVGSPTKTQLGNNPEYSGLIADTITIYTWERVA